LTIAGLSSDDRSAAVIRELDPGGVELTAGPRQSGL
jgi:hypothetical protein